MNKIIKGMRQAVEDAKIKGSITNPSDHPDDAEQSRLNDALKRRDQLNETFEGYQRRKKSEEKIKEYSKRFDPFKGNY